MGGDGPRPQQRWWPRGSLSPFVPSATYRRFAGVMLPMPRFERLAAQVSQDTGGPSHFGHGLRAVPPAPTQLLDHTGTLSAPPHLVATFAA